MCSCEKFYIKIPEESLLENLQLEEFEGWRFGVQKQKNKIVLNSKIEKGLTDMNYVLVKNTMSAIKKIDQEISMLLSKLKDYKGEFGFYTTMFPVFFPSLFLWPFYSFIFSFIFGVVCNQSIYLQIGTYGFNYG